MSLHSRRRFLTTSAMSAATAVAAASALPGSPPTLRVSRFSQEVTPPIGHPCMGGGIAPVKEILDPLLARGFVLTGVEKPVAVVVVDWCEIRNDAYDRWRDAIAQAIGTTRERVMLSAVHQHDAPIADLTAQQLLEKNRCSGSICDLAFHERTVRAVAESVRASLADARPVSHVGFGKGTVERIASNRRYLDDKGVVHHNRMSATGTPAIRNADTGTIDPILSCLSLWDGDVPLVALNSYATHPMSFYGRGGVTADFVGLARRRRDAELPHVLHLYASGCSGNVTAGKYNDGSAGNRPILADRLHAAMTQAWRDTKRVPVTSCSFRSVPLHLPVRSGVGFEEHDLRKELRESPRPFGQCLAALGLSWRRRVAEARPIDLTVLDFGSALYALLPAESYVEFQLAAKAVRPDDHVVVAGYGECGPGYIPTEQAWSEHDSNLKDWCWVDPGSEPRMLAAINRLLDLKRP